MGVFKEEISALEELARRQVRIYGDACDFGVHASKQVKDTMHWIVTSLPGMAKPTWKADGNCIQREYHSTVEWGGGDATAVKVLYVNDKPHKKEFFSIEMKAVRTEEDY